MRSRKRTQSRARSALTILSAWGLAATLSIAASSLFAPVSNAAADGAPAAAPARQLDRSGRTQTGKASFYAKRYSGRTMADGTPMHLYSDNAASLTLPLGSTARVTNLKTGLSAVVTIRDRGPYVTGRIIDLSPATARRIGLSQREGLTTVEVAPLTIPLRDGTVLVVSQAATRHRGGEVKPS